MSTARITPTETEFGTVDCATDVGRGLLEGAIETAFEARATALMAQMFERTAPRDECLAAAQRLLDDLAVAVNWCASAVPKPVGQAAVEDEIFDGMRNIAKALHAPEANAELFDVSRREHMRAMCIALLYKARPNEASLQVLTRQIARDYPSVGRMEVRRHLDYLETKGLLRITQHTHDLFFKLTAQGIDEAERMPGGDA